MTIKKAQGLKFLTSKKGCDKIDTIVCFCDGTIKDSKQCGPMFQKTSDKVEYENEGGPFGTPMRKLVDFLNKFKDHSELHQFDKTKIIKVLEEFNQEINKVSSPIVERRLIKPEEGNPSDKSYQDNLAAKKDNKNFKLKVTSTRGGRVNTNQKKQLDTVNTNQLTKSQEKNLISHINSL